MIGARQVHLGHIESIELVELIDVMITGVGGQCSSRLMESPARRRSRRLRGRRGIGRLVDLVREQSLAGVA
jgi:hypothetical protein